MRTSRYFESEGLGVNGPRMVVVLLLCTLVAACGKGRGDLELYVAEVKARRSESPLEPLPPPQQFETFEYAAQDLRDPFSMWRDDTRSGVASGPRPDPDRRKEALEAFPLDSLKMVGTLGRDDTNWGLVQDPDKVIHRVRPGNYLGQNDGRILAIREDRIQLMELVSDGGGGWREHEATIALDDK